MEQRYLTGHDELDKAINLIAVNGYKLRKVCYTQLELGKAYFVPVMERMTAAERAEAVREGWMPGEAETVEATIAERVDVFDDILAQLCRSLRNGAVSLAIFQNNELTRLYREALTAAAPPTLDEGLTPREDLVVQLHALIGTAQNHAAVQEQIDDILRLFDERYITAPEPPNVGEIDTVERNDTVFTPARTITAKRVYGDYLVCETGLTHNFCALENSNSYVTKRANQ